MGLIPRVTLGTTRHHRHKFRATHLLFQKICASTTLSANLQYFVYGVDEYFQVARDLLQHQTFLLQLDGLYLMSIDKAEVMMVAGRNCNLQP